MLSYFTDPILRGPTIGCMLMCLSASLVGVIAFLRKQSLIGEALSHASFPGVVAGVVVAAELSSGNQEPFFLPLITVIGAFLSALAGLFAIYFLEKEAKISADAALCFVLSSLFGLGVLLASRVQFTHAAWYVQSLSYLFGQAATMVDTHIFIYGILSFVVILVVLLFYKELQVFCFDANYAAGLGINTSLIRTLVFFLMALAIVVGIRSVGVVLMSAMLIAPAVASRQFTHKFSWMLLLAAFFGMASGYFGIFLSQEMTAYFSALPAGSRIVFPTGPMIVLVAALICLLSLLFAPERGVVIRLVRRLVFKYQCSLENMLKAMWRSGAENSYSIKDLMRFQQISRPMLALLIKRLVKKGWVMRAAGGRYRLTEEGVKRAAHIVRLHRLWEVYLADYLEMGVEKVHRSAEEMEHIITKEIEQELTELLHDPKYDPHDQPIPPFQEQDNT